MNKPTSPTQLYYPIPVPKIKICKLAPDGRHRFTIPSINCDWCGFGSVIVNGEVLYVPTEKGIEYHQRTESNVLLWGGRGSAKSTTGRWDAHMRALSIPNYKYIILRKTFPELEKTHLHAIPREMKLLGGTYNHTKHIANYPNGSTGFFSHCATEDDVLNLLGGEFYLAFFDEISTFDWEQFTKLAASVRAPVNVDTIPMVRAATNPLGPSAQKILEYFVDKTVDLDVDPDYIPGDWYAIKANLGDNPYLPADYKKRFSGLPAHVRKAWVDGDFALENALFDFYPTITGTLCSVKGWEDARVGKPYHVTNDIELDEILKVATIYRAIDSGWFPDPTVVLWIAHLGNRHIVFHEMVEYKQTAAEMAELIKQEDLRLGIHKVAMTYCDPSMDINTTADIRTIKEIYELNGVPMECSINKRDMFATTLHSALADEAGEYVPRLQIYTYGRKGCPYLAKSLPQMRYDQKRPEFMADHKDDHAVVALAYYLMSHASDPRNAPGSPSSLRPWQKKKNDDTYLLGKHNVRDH